MRTFPTRKRYLYELPTIYWTILLQFSQATSNESRNEYNNFSWMDAITFSKRYIKLLKSWCIWYNKKFYIPKALLRKCVLVDIDKIFADIAKLRYTIWNSIYSDQSEVKPEWYRPRALFNSDTYLAEKCNCSIEKVRDILTDEQIWFIIDDNRRDYYETFDKWKKLNDEIIKENDRYLSDQEKQVLEYIKEYNNRDEEYKKQKTFTT